MKGIIIFVLFATAAVAAMDFEIKTWPIPRVEHPVVNLPQRLRQHNWSRYREGSCVVASTVSLLNWQGHPKLAARLRANYGGGQWASGWHSKLTKSGVRFASTYNKKNVAWLERAIKTRRGACVAVNRASHMVCLVDLTATKAGILDNNYPDKIRWVEREAFLKNWFSSYSWAFTPIYTPTSPRLLL